MRILVVVVVVIVVGGVSACGSPCTGPKHDSVQATVVDGNGEAVAHSSVTFSTADGTSQPCGVIGASPATFSCGFDVDGTLTIHAIAPGFADQHQDVVVEKDPDGCHVFTKHIRMTLVPQ